MARHRRQTNLHQRATIRSFPALRHCTTHLRIEGLTRFILSLLARALLPPWREHLLQPGKVGPCSIGRDDIN